MASKAKQRPRHRGVDSVAEIEKTSASERERIGALLADAEACSNLWAAVIDLAVEDLRWLRRNRNARLNRYRRAVRREITEDDPREFLAGPALDYVCGLLGVTPAVLLRGYGLERPFPDRAEAA